MIYRYPGLRSFNPVTDVALQTSIGIEHDWRPLAIITCVPRAMDILVLHQCAC